MKHISCFKERFLQFELDIQFLITKVIMASVDINKVFMDLNKVYHVNRFHIQVWGCYDFLIFFASNDIALWYLSLLTGQYENHFWPDACPQGLSWHKIWAFRAVGQWNLQNLLRKVVTFWDELCFNQSIRCDDVLLWRRCQNITEQSQNKPSGKYIFKVNDESYICRKCFKWTNLLPENQSISLSESLSFFLTR